MAKPVIEVRNLGIEFYRSRRRRMSLREMVLKRQNSAPSDTRSYPCTTPHAARNARTAPVPV